VLVIEIVREREAGLDAGMWREDEKARHLAVFGSHIRKFRVHYSDCGTKCLRSRDNRLFTSAEVNDDQTTPISRNTTVVLGKIFLLLNDRPGMQCSL
jgi:hypothetical protein